MTERPASTTGKTATREGVGAGVAAGIGAAVGPAIGLDPVTGSVLIGGAIKALGSAIGKVARDRQHEGRAGALWAVLAALL